MKVPSSLVISGLFLILLTSFPAFSQKPELLIQTGHGASVLAVAFTSDRKLLASGSVDQTIKLWDPATATQLGAFKGHDGSINSLAFSPNDKFLASASADNTIKIWDVATGRVTRTLTGHVMHVHSVAFSPDGKLLASGSGDQQAKLWDFATGRELRTFTAGPDEHKGMGIKVAFTRDGATLATGGDTVKLWDVKTGNELKAIKTSPKLSPETPAVFSYDGKYLATGGNSVTLWELSTGKAIRTLPGRASSLSFSSDGELLSGSDMMEITVWNINSGQVVQKWEGPQQGNNTVTFGPDGKTLASGNSDHTVTLWEALTGRELQVLRGHVGAVHALGLSSDGRVLAHGIFGGVGRSDTLKLWDPVTGQLLRSLVGRGYAAYSIALSKDGRKLVSGSGGNSVGLWDVSQPEPLLKFADSTSPRFVPDRVAMSDDGRLIAAGGRNSEVKVWDVSTSRVLFTLTGHSNGIRDLAFAPDGRMLASSAQDKTIKLWSIATGKELSTLKSHVGGVLAIAFSPDSRKLVSGSQDMQITLWDVARGTPEKYFVGHVGWVNSVAFSPDGLKLASGSEDGAVHIWDVASERRLHLLAGHADKVNSVTFSHDGKLLISGSSDTTMKLWDVASGKELASLISLNRQDWLVVTPDGLFDGSPAAWNQILWRFSADLFDVAPVELFFNEYYHPGLLADLYAGRRPVAPQNIAQKDRRQPRLRLGQADGQPPTTSHNSRTLRLRIEIDSAPAGAQDVRLFRNGALVESWRGDVLKNQPRASLETEIPIVAGPNILTAYAFNRDNVKSADATLTVTGGDNLKRPGTLYVLAIAVNKYVNPEFDLLYAVADATDFAAELQRQEGRIKKYQRTEIIALHDTEATKANILTALRKLAGRVQPEDGLVVYFAGHGTAQQNQFYLIPHDLGYRGPRTKMDGVGLKTLLGHSISDRELEQAFSGIDAGRLLFVIDACNSGQALEAEEKRRGPMNSKGLAQLAYEKGIFILTAAQSYQAAMEPSDLKHGLLTYALIEEGLKKGAADSEPQDGNIHVTEWFGYVMKRVPEMQEQRMLQASQKGRQLVFVEGDEASDVSKRNVQRPRAFYRRELESQPFIIARTTVGVSTSP